MKRIITLLIPFCVGMLLLLSCQKSEHAGRQLLQQADSARTAGDYALAYRLIDSLNKTYLTDTINRRLGMTLKRAVMSEEAARNRRYIDSLMPLMQQRIDSTLRDFTLYGDTRYGTTPEYYRPVLLPARNLNRSYLRAAVQKGGDCTLTSVYSGGRALNHCAVKLHIMPDDITAATETVAYDGGLNYRYRDGGLFAELVSYQPQQSQAVTQLIRQAAREKKSLRMAYLSDSGQVLHEITLSQTDVQALAQTLQLSDLLMQYNSLQRDAEKADRRMARLQNQTQN